MFLTNLLRELANRSRIQRFIGVSGGHVVINRSQAEQLQYGDQWKNDSLPAKQLEIVKQELAAIKTSGNMPAHMRTLVDEIRQLALVKPSILEIGCSSGYYSEVFKLAGLAVQYTGCDYSESFIALAKQRYPHLPFMVCDGTKLPYDNNSFDIAISGCCILHIINYEAAIAETARVAKKYAIFHRTPVLHQRATTYTHKQGYGVDMIEILFNESELMDLFKQYGLAVVAIHTPALNVKLVELKEPAYTKNYVCMKI